MNIADLGFPFGGGAATGGAATAATPGFAQALGGLLGQAGAGAAASGLQSLAGNPFGQNTLGQNPLGQNSLGQSLTFGSTMLLGTASQLPIAQSALGTIVADASTTLAGLQAYPGAASPVLPGRGGHLAHPGMPDNAIPILPAGTKLPADAKPALPAGDAATISAPAAAASDADATPGANAAPDAAQPAPATTVAAPQATDQAAQALPALVLGQTDAKPTKGAKGAKDEASQSSDGAKDGTDTAAAPAQVAQPQPQQATPQILVAEATVAPPAQPVQPQPTPQTSGGKGAAPAAKGANDRVMAQSGTGASDATDGKHAPADAGPAPDFAKAVQTVSANNNAHHQSGGAPLPGSLRGNDAASGAAGAAPNAAQQPATPEIPGRAGAAGQALGVEIARRVADGGETLRVRMNPAELGRVDVTIGFDDGNLRATVHTESHTAMEILRRDTADLHRALDQAGIRADAQSFRFESGTGSFNQSAQRQAGQGQGQGQQQQHHHGQGQRFASGDGAADANDIPYRALRGSGQVDLFA